MSESPELSHTTSYPGQFKSYLDPFGNEMSVESHAAGGNIGELQRVHEEGATTYIDSLLYEYVETGDNAGLLESVVHRRKVGSSSWVSYQSVSYAYYGSEEDYGNLGDLKTATVTYPGGVSDTTYYRYYKEGNAYGYAHALQYVLYPESYARLQGSLSSPNTPQTVNESVLELYADHYFRYNSQHAATFERAQGAGCSTCSGGQGRFLYDYIDRTASPSYVPGPNSWAVKTTETLPDDNQNIVYTNGDGQVLLQVFVESPGSPSAKSWATYTRYDANGRMVLQADPSAVLGYSESYDDLVGYNPFTQAYQHLDDNGGMVTHYDFYDYTDAEDGAALGYLSAISISQGYDSTPIPQQQYTYVGHDDGNGTFVYQVETSTVFKDLAGADGLTTHYDYDFFDDSNRIRTEEIEDPTEGVTTIVYDEYGRPVWTKDAAGYISRVEYSSTLAFQSVVTATIDVDTSLISDEPDGWETPSDGGLHLQRVQKFDFRGRPYETIDPNLQSTVFGYSNAGQTTTVYPGFDYGTQSWVGPTIVVRNDRANRYVESKTESTVLESLSRSYVNSAGQTIYRDDYFDFTGLTFSTSAHIGTEDVNFYRTTFAYDSRGRLSKVWDDPSASGLAPTIPAGRTPAGRRA